MSTKLGRRAWITAKNANPVRQLGPKSFTSIPRRLEKKENHVAVKKKKKKSKCEQMTRLVMVSYIISNAFLRSSTTYLVAVCWTHRRRAFLAPPCRSDNGLLLTGELVVSVLLVELSREELLLDNAWSAGKLMVSSSI